MILEGLVTTFNDDGRLNVSPMGPQLDEHSFQQFELRPFATSQTYQNLVARGDGVLHVTDDVEMMARAAIGRLEAPVTIPAPIIAGAILANACRWYAFRVTEHDPGGERKRLLCQVVAEGVLRDFWGLNRAKHAVIEGAILATRLHVLEFATIQDEFRRLTPLIEKTGGHAEHRAWQMLLAFVERSKTRD